jgi:8-oxo-dGTP pyrophosphatase MutT (NUDIX family)
MHRYERDAMSILLHPVSEPQRTARDASTSPTRSAMLVYRHLLGEPYFLLVSTRRNRDRLTLPGGMFEANESSLQTAIRETIEEAGVWTESHRVLGCYPHKKTSGAMYPTQTHLGRFAGYRPDHEQRELHWLNVAEVIDAGRRVRQPIRELIQHAADVLPSYTASA